MPATGFRASCKKMAKKAIKDAVAKAEDRFAKKGPEDPEAYAAQVAETIKADVRMFSGCMDCQLSADVAEASMLGSGGACVNALVETLNRDSGGSWLSVLKGMQGSLAADGFKQIPQLSASSQIDINDDFYLINPSVRLLLNGGNGNTRSLLIGINYVGTKSELSGCHNDAIMMKEYIATHGYKGDEENCRMLLDDGVHRTPDYKGMIDGFRWLVHGAKAGDSLFMLFSAGHGGSVKDTSGDEADGMDETLCPVDYEESGQIVDDDIFEELVLSLPEGVTLTVVIDACHSGSALDLPYCIQADKGTIAAVEAGEQSSLMSLNSGLNKLILVGKGFYDMYKTKKVDVDKLKDIASLAALGTMGAMGTGQDGTEREGTLEG
eukprot:jgi/Undpi1/8169/HiC_scaffold_24.g10639.m1